MDNSFIQDLMDRFGSDGYLVFFGFLEMMSKEFDIHNPGIVTLSRTFCRRKLRLSWHKCSTILKFCEERKRFFVSDNGRQITINCPKLKKMCDEWTQKQLRSVSGVNPDELRPKEEEEDIRKEKEKEKERRDFIPDSGKEKKEYISKWSDFLCKNPKCGKKAKQLIDGLCPECNEESMDKIFEAHQRERKEEKE